MLPKIRITSKKASNKSCSELNFVRKSTRANISIGPMSGAYGLHRSVCLKSYNVQIWEIRITYWGSTLPKIRTTSKKAPNKSCLELNKSLRENMSISPASWGRGSKDQCVWNLMMYSYGKLDSLWAATLPKILITSKKASYNSSSKLNFVHGSLRAHMSIYPTSRTWGSTDQCIWNLMLYRFGKLDSLWGSMLSKICITWKKGSNYSCLELNKSPPENMSISPRSGARRFQRSVCLESYNVQVDSQWGSTLPKILITSWKASNKSCLELNFVPKSPQAHMFIFPTSGAWGSKDQCVWNLIQIWEIRFTLGLNAAKNTHYIKKGFK